MRITTANQEPQTAAACYAERLADCRRLVAEIGLRLDSHEQNQAKDATNWGHAGDLAHVREQLAYSLASLGDRSAVDKFGLEY